MIVVLTKYEETSPVAGWRTNIKLTFPISFSTNIYKIITGGEFVYDTKGISIGNWQKSTSSVIFGTFNISNLPVDLLIIGF